MSKIIHPSYCWAHEWNAVVFPLLLPLQTTSPHSREREREWDFRLLVWSERDWYVWKGFDKATTTCALRCIQLHLTHHAVLKGEKLHCCDHKVHSTLDAIAKSDQSILLPINTCVCSVHDVNSRTNFYSYSDPCLGWKKECVIWEVKLAWDENYMFWAVKFGVFRFSEFNLPLLTNLSSFYRCLERFYREFHWQRTKWELLRDFRLFTFAAERWWWFKYLK